MITKKSFLFSVLILLPAVYLTGCGGLADPVKILADTSALSANVVESEESAIYKELIRSRAWTKDCMFGDEALEDFSDYEIRGEETVDLDADGIDEFFCVAVMKDGYADLSRFPEMYSLFYTIRDGDAACLFTSYMSSGSMGGGVLSSAVDPVSGELLLCEAWQTSGWGGDAKGKNYFSLRDGGLVNVLSYAETCRPKDLYEKGPLTVRTPYYEDEDSIITDYEVNGKPATVKEYRQADLFVPAEGEQWFSSEAALTGLGAYVSHLSERADDNRRVRAWLEDGKALLTLDRDFWREYLGVEIAEDFYRVNGLSRPCVGVYVDTLGWRVAPMVLFLMEDGKVEYLDVESALLQSADPANGFSSMGALPGLTGIIGFIPGYPGDAETDDGVYSADNKTVFAIDRSGRKFDVFLAYTAKGWLGDWAADDVDAGGFSHWHRLSLSANGALTFCYGPGQFDGNTGEMLKGFWRIAQPGSDETLPTGAAVFQMAGVNGKEDFFGVYDLRMVDNTLNLRHISGSRLPYVDASENAEQFHL
jgi:hypothetical protein